MTKYLMKLFFTMVMVIGLSIAASAQSKGKDPKKVPPKKKPPVIKPKPKEKKKKKKKNSVYSARLQAKIENIET
ncbi:MAG: hypothetical protein HKN25_00835 [Pyrinomonadaceae bacterium]|nr:hypothetical protein [Pyrinomonadaceae bacterium]